MSKGARRPAVTIDPSTVRALHAGVRQAEERLVVESDWPESDLVFRTAFGEPFYPDTPSQLLPKLIAQYNRHPTSYSVAMHPAAQICGISMQRHCYSPACLCTSWLPGWSACASRGPQAGGGTDATPRHCWRSPAQTLENHPAR